MTPSLITLSAHGAIAAPLASGPWAATSTKSGFDASDAIAVLVVIVVIALVMVIVLGMRPRRSTGLGSAKTERIKRAAAEDVEAIEEDDKYFRPDAPGHVEDDL